MKKRILTIAGIATALFVVLFLSSIFPLSFYLPHEIPKIVLPFDAKYDSVATLMPMGEKINHPDAPSGHPGVDYNFDTAEKVPLFASMDGKITKVKITKNQIQALPDRKPISLTVADVLITNKSYQVFYGELDAETLPASTKIGREVKRGDFIGHGNFMTGNTPGNMRQMTHWEFGSISPLIDRFCPLDYFAEESRIRIERIWNNTNWPEMKSAYPKICNGDYDGKFEK